MFETLSERLAGVFDGLRGKGALSEKEVMAALREVRVALLEADVALPVARDFVGKVKERAVGQEVMRSVTPGQQVVKIVHDTLIDTLGGDATDGAINLNVNPPAVILMAGLQGSGKTTTTAKIALRLTKKERKKVLMASLDTRRPAAMEQLAILGKQADVKTLPIVEGQAPVDIAKRAVEAARLGGYDVVILDTAGRLSIDEQLMAEVAEIQGSTNPVETLLVVDSLTGQDAVETAARFKERLTLTGVVLTRIDGDGRGGAALSMRAVTGTPIKFIGTGEKIDAIDVFDPKRMAGRILGMGDIVALVEKASEEVDQKKAEQMAKKLAKGKFDLDDLAEQFRQMRKMGGLGAIMNLMPGMGKMKKQIDAAGGFEGKEIARQEAIISSMTKQERKNPKLLNASRKRRVAAGSGTSVQEVNKILKAHQQMSTMMKKMGKGGMGKHLARQMMGKGGGQMGGQMGGMLGGMGGGMPPQGSPMGGGLPGLGAPGGADPLKDVDLSKLGKLPGLGGPKKK